MKFAVTFTIFSGLLILAGCAKGQTTGAASVEWNGEVKEFTIRAFQFGFEPDTLEVDLGDKVVINAYSSDVPHSLAILGYGVDLPLIPGTPVSTEFIADRAGYYTFQCNIPCGRGHGAMRGKLIVKE